MDERFLIQRKEKVKCKKQDEVENQEQTLSVKQGTNVFMVKEVNSHRKEAEERSRLPRRNHMKGWRRTEKRDLAEELCELMGWDDVWATCYTPLPKGKMRKLIKRLKGKTEGKMQQLIKRLKGKTNGKKND